MDEIKIQNERENTRVSETLKDRPTINTEERPGFEVNGSPGKGITVRNKDDSYTLTLRARMQVRETLGFGEKTSNEINVKTVRLVTHGHVFSPKIRYNVQLAFGPGDFDSSSPSPIFDAFVEFTKLRNLHIKFGQYFVPFDRARTIREFALQLVDRQQTISELNLDRDVGVSIYSPNLFGWDHRLNYSLGIFGGEGRNRVGSFKPGFLYTARLGLRPFGEFDDDVEGDLAREKAPRLAIGVAVAYNDNTDRQRSTIGKVLTAGTFDYTHAAADLVFKWRGISLLSEAISRRANHAKRTREVDGESVTEYSRSGWGYLLQAGVMVLPKLEVAVRWDQTLASGATYPALVELVKKQGRELGGGLNWYINGHFFKIQADYAVRFDRLDVRAAHVARLQLDATF
jgi:hypothetical protein